MGVLWREFYDGTRMNSQTNVQSEVNLHKLRKKVVMELGIKMVHNSHGQPNSQNTPQLKFRRSSPLFFL
jgi:hypothetical protein